MLKLKTRVVMLTQFVFALVIVLSSCYAAKLVVRVCDGPACSVYNPMTIATAIDTASEGKLDVSFSRCMGWCKRSCNVKVIPEGAADGIKLPNMTDIELASACFHAVNTPSDAARIANSVSKHVSAEEEKAKMRSEKGWKW